MAYVLTMEETTMKRRLVSLSGAIVLGLGVGVVHADIDAASRAAAERVCALNACNCASR